MAKHRIKYSTGRVEEVHAKVRRRSKKLVKSLRRLLAQNEPGPSPVLTLLKALEKALPELKQRRAASDSEDGRKIPPKRAKQVSVADAPHRTRA
jgi:hypothetical protein